MCFHLTVFILMLNAHLKNIQTIMSQYKRKTASRWRNFGFERNSWTWQKQRAVIYYFRVDNVPEEVVGDQVREAGVGPQYGSDALDVLTRGDVRLRCRHHHEPRENGRDPFLSVGVLCRAQHVQQLHHRVDAITQSIWQKQTAVQKNTKLLTPLLVENWREFYGFEYI